jgi:hypothetical protein
VAIESLGHILSRAELEAEVELARKRTVEILRFWDALEQPGEPRSQEGERHEVFRVMPPNASFLSESSIEDLKTESS